MVRSVAKMKRSYAVFTLMTLCAQILVAQVKLSIQAPGQTEVGERIRVSYVANTKDIEDIQVGEFPGFKVLYGPSTSSSSSFSIVNGKTTQSSSLTFTYTLLATEEGTHKLPVATVKVDGKSYKSGEASIEVLPSGTNAGGVGQQGGGRQSSRKSRTVTGSSQDITSEDLYMAVTASKKKIYEQEAVLLTYKLYSLVNIQQLSGEIPQLDGCHVQEINNKAQMSLKYESVNGRNYATGVWKQYVIYPQKTGTIKVPAVTFDSQVEFTNTSMDPFDVFFGGGSLTQMVRKQIVAPAVEIEVLPLPTPKPANFSGAVGKFSISASLTPEQVNANDAATLRLVVSGNGNMKLMSAPNVAFPQDFEVYKPKETDKTTNTAIGAKGNFIYDYVVVPRHGGKYSIAPVEFVYFNPEDGKYETLRTDSFSIAVAKAKGGSAIVQHEQEELKVIDSDIRFIHLGDVSVNVGNGTFFGSNLYWGLYAALLLSFGIVATVFKKQIKENANMARQRGRRAGKAAGKRMKNAAVLMKSHQSALFYDEVMKALLGYVCDKLNLPVSDLTKDNVAGILNSKGVSDQLVKDYMDVLSECEFARFAPGDPQATMDKIFSKASEVIDSLDAVIKKV